MGGPMRYSRFRTRNGLAWRPETPADPYPRNDQAGNVFLPYTMVVGDLNRMEQDYMGLTPEPIPDENDRQRYTWGVRDTGIIHELAEDSGIDADTCRQVLASFFGFPTPWPRVAPREEGP